MGISLLPTALFWILTSKYYSIKLRLYSAAVFTYAILCLYNKRVVLRTKGAHMFDLDFELSFALELAETQGRVMRRGFRRGRPRIVIKDDGSPVTDDDMKISRHTVGTYAKRGKKVASEEGGTGTYDDENVFVLDPIDGTLDYIEGQRRSPRKSMAMFSLGLVIKKRPVMGVTCAPLLGITPRLYGALSGRAAMRYENGDPKETLHVAESATTGVVLVSPGRRGERIAERLAAMGFRPLTLQPSVFKAVSIADPNLIRTFDARLLDEHEAVVGFISPSNHPHDYIASSVIVEAAGGIATAPSGGPLGGRGCVMSVNEGVHQKLLEAAQV
ncbi:inositol monophosphatase [candidate division TM7 genomosp. GTL1]|nr:inositol monophosphatase [candidate division TM7 genomosp. GTL1]